jgi:MFS family permease
MKAMFQLLLVAGLCVGLLFGAMPLARAASAPARTTVPAQSTPGLEAAKTLSLVTGVAISPLLGVGSVGAYHYFQAPRESRARLGWYAQPWFWVPALLLVALVAAKDLFGAAAPTALKKPFDVAEAVENKISALIAAGAFVPLVVSVFPTAAGNSSQGLSLLGFAALDPAAIGNALLVPVALVVFFVVWLASHAINMLILISPFTTVDAALKAFRLSLLGLVTGTSFTNPYLGAALSVVVVVVAYLIAGWSFRLTTFGTVYIWDFVTVRRRRFQPGAETNWMFTARPMEGAPIRTYGRLVHRQPSSVCFEYRPWLVLPKRSFTLPPGKYVVGRGLFYPEIAVEEDDRLRTLFVMPPRFRTHEDAVARAYGFAEVRDIGLKRGLEAVKSWAREMFGARRAPTASAAPDAAS